MKAICTHPFPGLPDGETVVKNFQEGDPVYGDLAAVAVEEGWAEEVDDDGDSEAPERPAAKRAGKGKKGRASGSSSEAGGEGGGEGEG